MAAEPDELELLEDDDEFPPLDDELLEDDELPPLDDEPLEDDEDEPERPLDELLEISSFSPELPAPASAKGARPSSSSSSNEAPSAQP